MVVALPIFVLIVDWEEGRMAVVGYLSGVITVVE